MIEDAIVNEIVKQTGLPEEVVRLVISQSNGDFKTFLELLKTAKRAHTAGKSIANMTSIISGNGDLDDLVDEGTNLIDAITGGDSSSVIDTITGGDSSSVTDGLSDLTKKIPISFPW